MELLMQNALTMTVVLFLIANKLDTMEVSLTSGSSVYLFPLLGGEKQLSHLMP
jgi:hypothetical protein